MRFGKSLFLWVSLFLVLTFFYNTLVGPGGGRYVEIPFSELLSRNQKQEVASVVVNGPQIKGEFRDGQGFVTYSPGYPDLVKELQQRNVKIEVEPLDSPWKYFFSFLLQLLPFMLAVGGIMFLMRHMQGGGKGGGALGFGRSRARLMDVNKKKILFKDVAGVEEAKEDLEEVVEFLRNPQKFSKLGGKIPRGCLLVGPPGTGKTLLARAVAGEAGVPFFTISGSDFVEMFVGVGASRVRDLFEQGKKNAPCLIFIDEIDAVGRHRGAGLGGGNDEREQTLNQLLVEMDGFEPNEGIIILAATNRRDVLDPALLRPGRFDRQVIVGLPDIKGRQEILNVHVKATPLAPDVDLHVIARGTPGFTGADLANLVNEAALLSARRNKKVVTMAELEEAKDKVMMGAERKSMVISEEERRLTAFHEGGHAIVSLHCPESDPIHKATIIPRGGALGMVMRLPETDRLSYTRGKAKADMAVAMGGRVAEELIFGYLKVTSGASSDIKYATNLARAMVTEWGMSDKVGPVFHSGDQEEVFLGKSFAKGKTTSETTADLIDEEVKSLVNEGYQLAKNILTKNRHELDLLAEALLEYETLSGEQVKDILKGKKPIRPEDHKKGTRKNVRISSIPEEEDEKANLGVEEKKKPKRVSKPKNSDEEPF